MNCKLFAVALLAIVVNVATFAQAEPRTWTAASGGFSTSAEYLGTKPEGATPNAIVVLRLADGTIRDVQVSLLCEADQKFIKDKLAGTPATGTAPAATTPGAAPQLAPVSAGQKMDQAQADRNLAALEREAKNCKTAEEAIVMYTVFLSDPTIPDATRTAAAEKMAAWKQLSDQKLVRMGTKWVTIDEAREARIKSVFLVNQGLEMVRLNQDKLGLEKLLEASNASPEDIQADFIIATVFAIALQKFDKAETHYKICLKRDPGNPAVLNNLALSLIRLNRPQEALGFWRTAASTCHDERIVENIGRLFEQAGSKKIFVPPAVVSQLSDIYATLVLSKNVSAATHQRGWQYMPLPQQPPVDETVQAIPADSTLDPTTAVCGTGFVVMPEYILTTRASTKGSSGFLIADPNEKGKTLPAQLIASHKDYDLALIRCPGLAAPALPLDLNWARIGTEVLVASYPIIDMQASSLKVGRGVTISPGIVNQHSGVVVYEIAKAPSVPGGPVVDSMGNAIALHWKSNAALNNRYNAGIPLSHAERFMRDNIPNFRPVSPNKADQPMDEVEKQTAKSTIVVLSQNPASDVGLNKRVGEGFLIDNSCCRCNGRTTMECPVRNCARGKISVERRVQTGRGPQGQVLYMDVHDYVDCNNCDGSGRVRCSSCGGSGVDSSVSRSPSSRRARAASQLPFSN